MFFCIYSDSLCSARALEQLIVSKGCTNENVDIRPGGADEINHSCFCSSACSLYESLRFKLYFHKLS